MIANLIAALAIAATAQNYDTDRFEVRELESANGCAMVGDWAFEGRSNIYLQVDHMIDGDVFVALTSYGWTRPAQDVRKIVAFNFKKPDAADVMIGTLGLPSTGLRPGLVALVFEEDRESFLAELATASSVNVRTMDPVVEGEALDPDDVKLVLQARLTGSSQAVANLRQCSANLKRREDARREREARYDHIAKDPFSD